ncbi:MAG: 5'-nucleotidase C-terminal domain-containing protein [Abditibacteriota bacterium]|nr:5'-nucleotidase C-terminal domain-containing protein [Abditibacteriota bacterium]
MKKYLILLLLVLTIPVFSITTTPDYLSTKNLQKESTSGGNFVADAISNAVDCDIVFVGTCDLKELKLKSTTPTNDEVLELLSKKGSQIGVITLTGEQLDQVLNKAISIYPKNNPAFLQVSGLNLTFNPEKKGAEKILKLKINGKDLEKDKSYKVAMSSDLGAGAFGYWKIWEPKDFKKTDITMEKAILDYLEKDPIKNFFLKRIMVGE